MRYPPKPKAIAGDITSAIESVSRSFRVESSKIMNGRRRESDMRPRLALYLVLARFDDKSVCRTLGVHRTTLVHGRRSARDWFDSCEKFRNLVNASGMKTNQ